jgi:pimeloyl-ACP methyl ester carboxylesterase
VRQPVRLTESIVLTLLAVFCVTGCGASLTPRPDRVERMTRGYIYYLDGAGGGRAMRNYAGGVKEGLLAAGCKYAGEMFDWNTGMGVVADQTADVGYKRGKAAELARKIREYQRQYPGAPVSLIALSAGTAIAVFTLDALPENCPVDNVVLLGASISDNYDLTQALRRVRNKLFIITSERDTVLGFLMPASGTADRKFGEAAAGLRGFVMPDGATADTRRLYAEKLITIPWTEQFERDGDYGRHLDNVNKEFVRDHVAPLVMEGNPRDKGAAK